MWKQERTDGDMRRKCREGRGRLRKAKEGGEGGRLRIGSGLGLVQGSSLGGRGFPPLFAPWSGF